MDQWNSSDFKESILSQTRRNKLLLHEEYPQQIVLNSYWIGLFFELHSLSIGIGDKEVSKNLKTDLFSQKLLINKTYIMGDGNSVETEIAVQSTNFLSEKFIGIIHTHPVSSPFSFLDLSHLVISPRCLLISVIQRDRTVLLAIRTKRTEKLDMSKDFFESRYEGKYRSFLTTDEKLLIANLLVAEEFKLAFYMGKLDMESNEMILRKKALVRND